MVNIKHILSTILWITIILFLGFNTSNAKKKPIKVEDIMKIRVIEHLTISEDGNFIAYTATPERGDPQGIVQSVLDTFKYIVERGNKPVFSKDGNWVAMSVLPSAVEIENEGMSKVGDDTMLALLNTSNGKIDTFKRVNKFEFSNDSRWIAFNETGIKPVPDTKDKSKDPKITGGKVFLYSLNNKSTLELNDVTDYSFDSTGKYFVFVRVDKNGDDNGLFFFDLQAQFSPPKKIIGGKNDHFSELTWNNKNSNLAFVNGKENKRNRPDSCRIIIWNSSNNNLDTAVSFGVVHSDWYIPFKNKLKWTEDGERLFFGLKPKTEEYYKSEDPKFADSTIYALDSILKKESTDIWHWNDPRIKPHQKKWWSNNKDRVFNCVYYPSEKVFIQLANMEVPDVQFTDNPEFAIGYNEDPYLKEQTWDGFYSDLYLVSLKTGKRKRIAEKLDESAHLSPFGKYTVFFKNRHWHIYDNQRDSSWNLTEIIKTPFWDVDNDLPREPQSYGLGAWSENDEMVFLYDKYDIWRFETDPEGSAYSQTAAEGISFGYQIRIINLEKDKKFFNENDDIFLSAYNDREKFTNIYKTSIKLLGTEKLIDGKKNFTLRAKAKEADRIIFTQQSFEEYPDIWLTNSLFSFRHKVTDLGKQIEDFIWGEAELVRWISEKGDSLDGVFIKPENFDAKKKYPVIVFFYEKFSPNMYNFWAPRNRHLPFMPEYLADGYCFFLPDIVYKTGFPGRSAMQCIMPGIEKLREMGYADTSKLGIWGHSWSGYQTAYILGNTDKFKAGVAGAPVGNMISAYSGIRHGSGLARQFQYEKQQSRIGGTLWDSLDNYIENSPIFHAPTMNTPLLIMHGDADDAVPWEQAVELYLAMRRLEKPAILVQYKGEPHWPSKYPNKLDWSIRMKQFFDHFMLGKAAPDWIKVGREYKGD